VLALALLLFAPVARAEALRVVVDISDQQMVVEWDHHPIHRWPVSTARPGKWTPRGTFHPQTLVRMHYSSLYNNAPMPWSIFFRGNYAIHGTDQVKKLGTPASAGCIRLSPANAKVLYRAVKAVGKGSVVIVVKD
jgi:lipoprotein-anchoring transpeptidase ErfK/SrfK